MKLYDMEKHKWREARFKPGDRWRADQVYRCDICGCGSNEFHMRGGMYCAPRLVCLGNDAKPDLHELLQGKVQEVEEKKHPASYLAELGQEIEAMRQRFRDVPPDVEGVPPQWSRHYGHFG